MTQNYEDFKTEPSAATNNTRLAHHIFANPQEFLEVLQKDFDHIATTDPDWLTKTDLIIYSDHGSDPKGREAARIAADHFDDFHEMSELLSSTKGISKDDLQLDKEMVQGLWRLRLSDYELEAAAVTVGTAIVAASMAVVTAACSEVPPLALIPGILAGGMAITSGAGVYTMIKGPAKLKALAEHDKETLERWTK